MGRNRVRLAASDERFHCLHQPRVDVKTSSMPKRVQESKCGLSPHCLLRNSLTSFGASALEGLAQVPSRPTGALGRTARPGHGRRPAHSKPQDRADRAWPPAAGPLRPAGDEGSCT